MVFLLLLYIKSDYKPCRIILSLKILFTCLLLLLILYSWFVTANQGWETFSPPMGFLGSQQLKWHFSDLQICSQKPQKHASNCRHLELTSPKPLIICSDFQGAKIPVD